MTDAFPPLTPVTETRPPEPIPTEPRRLNAAYVLSAICMIFGLFALNGSLDFSPLPASNLLLLIGVLNVYEILTLLIARMLHGRGILVDARTLVLVESVFLFDGAFLTSELIAVMPSVGVPIALALLIAGTAKLAIILGVAGQRFTSRLGAMAMVMLAVLLAMPWMFKTIVDAHAGLLPPSGYYAGWWIAALVPIAAAVFWRREDGALMHTIFALGAISVIAHIGTAAWVNKVTFTLDNLAPVILGIALVIGNRRLFFIRREIAIQMQILLPVLAVLVSTRNAMGMHTDLFDLTLTPLRLTLLATGLLYLHGLLRHHDWRFGVGLAGGLTLAVAGASPQAIGGTITGLIRTAIETVNRLIPRTLMQWGWVSVSSAFILLIGGTIQSMRRAQQRIQ
ncbi:MAG: hypothetical protein H7144_05180 [Burkholderiales bacterium]|nr:hypothetical protein [Phycisphaerae bacterium]